MKFAYGTHSGWVECGSGTVESITAGTGLTGGTITKSGAIALANTAITPGTVAYPSSITFNAQGQATAAVAGTAPAAGDSNQTLISSANINWDVSQGNLATLILNTNATISLTNFNRGVAILYVKQDSVGSRFLRIATGIYKTGSPVSILNLSTSANAIDVITFYADLYGGIYCYDVRNTFVPAVPSVSSSYTYDYGLPISDSISLLIPDSPNNLCTIKLLGGGGGGGVWDNRVNTSVVSGAGGFTIYKFNTINYIGQYLKFLVGQGGGGGVWNSASGEGGFFNGGNGYARTSSANHFCGGGGGRTDVRIGTEAQSFVSCTKLAMAGGGGGGSASSVSYNSGAGGGSTGESSFNATGGSQSSGGVTSGFLPAIPAASLQGAGNSTTNISSESRGGGGDGYYGGAVGSSDAGGAGGSGYINTAFSGYVSSGSGTYTGIRAVIPTQASSDSRFTGGYGVGRNAVGQTNAQRGGNGRLTIDFT